MVAKQGSSRHEGIFSNVGTLCTQSLQDEHKSGTLQVPYWKRVYDITPSAAAWEKQGNHIGPCGSGILDSLTQWHIYQLSDASNTAIYYLTDDEKYPS